MYIHEAVQEAMAKGLAITRDIAPDCGMWHLIAIVPTNTSDCCFIGYADVEEASTNKIAIGRRWNPLAKDLIADDWKVTNYMKSADLMKVIR